MEQRSMKARRALHALRGYVAQLTWEADQRDGKRLLKELERLVDTVALRPARTQEPIEYSRQDKIREELANDPTRYD